MGRGDVQPCALSIGQYDGDGKSGVKHGLEDRPRPRDENGQTHGVNLGDRPGSLLGTLVSGPPAGAGMGAVRGGRAPCETLWSPGEIDRIALL